MRGKHLFAAALDKGMVHRVHLTHIRMSFYDPEVQIRPLVRSQGKSSKLALPTVINIPHPLLSTHIHLGIYLKEIV